MADSNGRRSSRNFGISNSENPRNSDWRKGLRKSTIGAIIGKLIGDGGNLFGMLIVGFVDFFWHNKRDFQIRGNNKINKYSDDQFVKLTYKTYYKKPEKIANKFKNISIIHVISGIVISVLTSLLINIAPLASGAFSNFVEVGNFIGHRFFNINDCGQPLSQTGKQYFSFVHIGLILSFSVGLSSIVIFYKYRDILLRYYFARSVQSDIFKSKNFSVTRFFITYFSISLFCIGLFIFFNSEQFAEKMCVDHGLGKMNFRGSFFVITLAYISGFLFSASVYSISVPFLFFRRFTKGGELLRPIS